MLLEDGPTTYGKQDLREASDLAAKIVAHYGMTQQGLLLFVPHVEQRARAEAGVSHATVVGSLDSGVPGL